MIMKSNNLEVFEGDNELRFFKLKNSQYMGELCDKHPNAFRLLNLIVRRVKTNDEYHPQLSYLQCFIGRSDHKKLGISERNFRTALTRLVSDRQVTTQQAPQGTKVTITKECIYDFHAPVTVYTSDQVGDRQVTTNLEKEKELNTLSSSSSKTSERESSLRELNAIGRDVIQYLNETCNRNYKYIESHLLVIRGRIREGATIDDFKCVIDKKRQEWQSTEHAKYLRPQTLFAAKHFDSYLNQPEPEEDYKQSW